MLRARLALVVVMVLSAGCRSCLAGEAACVADEHCPFERVCVEGRCLLAAPPADAGAAVDAGVPGDAGAPDAGPFDAGLDAGLDTGLDAGLDEDDGGLDEDDGGCADPASLELECGGALGDGRCSVRAVDDADAGLPLAAACLECVAQAAAPTVVVLDEDFAGCDLSAWSENGSLSCTTNFDCPTNNELLEANGGSGSLTRTLDFSDVESAPSLCFHYGDDAASGADFIRWEVDTGAGLAKVFEVSGAIGTDQTCQQSCVDLSTVVPAANGNGSVTLKLTMQSGNKVDVDSILVSGLGLAPEVGAGALVDEGAGAFGFTLEGADAGPIADVTVTCSAGDVQRTATASLP